MIFDLNKLKLKEQTLKIIEKGSKFLALLLLIVHIISCISCFIGLHEDYGWVEENSSLLPTNYKNQDIYIASVYWTMTTFTTIGYGDFTAVTTAEYLFQCLIMLMGIGFFGYIIGNVRSIFVQVESISQIKNLYEEEFNLWLIRMNKSNKVKMMRNDYFTYGAK